eukprot:EG_transcript_41705
MPASSVHSCVDLGNFAGGGSIPIVPSSRKQGFPSSNKLCVMTLELLIFHRKMLSLLESHDRGVQSSGGGGRCPHFPLLDQRGGTMYPPSPRLMPSSQDATKKSNFP